MDFKEKIREVRDWPKEGVNFKDITTLLQDGDAFREAVDAMAEFFKDKKIDKVAGIDARGFLIAAPVAYKLGKGLSILRKAGKLPFSAIKREYTLEYASNTLEMHKDAVSPGENVLLIDDLIATGGSAMAACDLIEELGGVIAGAGFIVNLPFLGGFEKLKARGYEIKSLVSYDGE